MSIAVASAVQHNGLMSGEGAGGDSGKKKSSPTSVDALHPRSKVAVSAHCRG